MRTHFMYRAVAALIVVLGLAFGSTGASAAGKGQVCGGLAGIPCDKGLWCQNAPGLCKMTDVRGKCDAIPLSCTLQFAPVCGCDGKTYGNDCERQGARAQLAYKGKCKKT